MSGNEMHRTYDLYCQVSSWLGIVDFYYAKHIVGKLFWVTVILFGISLTLWQTVGLIRGFTGGPRFQTTISGETTDDGTALPNVTVCNYNRAKQSLINSDNISSETLSYLFHLFPIIYDKPLKKDQTNPNSTVYENAYRDLIRRNSSYVDPKIFFNVYGHQFTETVLGLSDGGYDVLNDMKHEAVFTSYGLCWKLIPNRNQTIVGSGAGVKLFINPLISEYLTNVFMNNYLSEGIVLHVGYIFEPLLPIPYIVAPGSSVEMVLTASRHKITYPDIRIFDPVCRNNLTLGILDAEYTQSNCYFDCYLTSLLNACGCVTLASTKKIHPVCNLTTMFDCASTVYTTDEMLPKCVKQCQKPCTGYTTLSAVVTTAKSVSGPLQKLIYKSYYVESDLNYLESLVKSSISINVYFGSPEVMVIETTEAIPLLTLIGNFGGVLGLWTGISIVTLIQFVYYVMLSCFRGEIFRCKRNRVRSSLPMKPKATNFVTESLEEL